MSNQVKMTKDQAVEFVIGFVNQAEIYDELMKRLLKLTASSSKKVKEEDDAPAPKRAPLSRSKSFAGSKPSEEPEKTKAKGSTKTTKAATSEKKADPTPRGSSGYNVFTTTFKLKNKSADRAATSAAWKALSDDERAKYTKLAQEKNAAKKTPAPTKSEYDDSDEDSTPPVAKKQRSTTTDTKITPPPKKTGKAATPAKKTKKVESSDDEDSDIDLSSEDEEDLPVKVPAKKSGKTTAPAPATKKTTPPPAPKKKSSPAPPAKKSNKKSAVSSEDDEDFDVSEEDKAPRRKTKKATPDVFSLSDIETDDDDEDDQSSEDESISLDDEEESD